MRLNWRARDEFEGDEIAGVDSPVKPENDIQDLRPEFCRYRDEGCELAESCLNCPFIKCIYDEPGGKQRWILRLRAREIARLHINERKKIKELAGMFCISERTVQRALKEAKGLKGCHAGGSTATEASQGGVVDK